MRDEGKNWLQGQDLNLRSRGYEPRGMSSSLPCGRKTDRRAWRTARRSELAPSEGGALGANVKDARSLSGLLFEHRQKALNRPTCRLTIFHSRDAGAVDAEIFGQAILRPIQSLAE